MGPNLAWLLKNSWYRQRIVTKEGKFLGTAFGKGREVTQVNPASTIIFIILVDVVVQAVLYVV